MRCFVFLQETKVFRDTFCAHMIIHEKPEPILHKRWLFCNLKGTMTSKRLTANYKGQKGAYQLDPIRVWSTTFASSSAHRTRNEQGLISTEPGDRVALYDAQRMPNMACILGRLIYGWGAECLATYRCSMMFIDVCWWSLWIQGEVRRRPRMLRNSLSQRWGVIAWWGASQGGWDGH